MTTPEEAKPGEAVKSRLFAEFLESTAPYTQETVTDLTKIERYVDGSAKYLLALPQIRLHCEREDCQGLRFFEHLRRFEDRQARFSPTKVIRAD